MEKIVPVDAIVIGAGLNGLVAAGLLAQRRLSVVIVDQYPTVGGAATTGEIAPGFRIPRLSHSLGPLRPDVIRALQLDRSGIEFLTSVPSLTTLGPGGQTIVFHPDSVLTAGSIERVSKADSARWRDFLLASQQIAHLFWSVNQQPPPVLGRRTPTGMWRMLQLGHDARRLGRLNLSRLARYMPMSVSDVLAEWFENDLLKAAIAAHAVFGNFAGPRSAGTGAMLLQRIADDPSPVGSGVTVRGGPGVLAAALAKTATDAGAKVFTGAKVARVLTRGGRVTGVRLENGDEIRASVVISAIDPRQTLLQLIEAEDLTPTFLERAQNVRARGVTAKINLALSGLPSFPAVEADSIPLRGRLLIAPGLDYIERAFDAAKYGELSSDPWLEIAIPSVMDPALAPEGAHVLSIYAHFAPRHPRGGPWSQYRDALYQSVMRVLHTHAPGIDRLVVDKEVLTPEDLELTWGLPGGHIFHGDSTLDQWWMTRPQLGWAHYRTPVAGLYLASAGTHPGGGLTGGSGLLAAQAVLKDLRK